MTVAQIAAAAAGAVPNSTVRHYPGRRDQTRGRTASTSLLSARAFDDYEPRWSVADGAAELYERYTRWGLTKADFSERFTRLAHLERLKAAGTLDESLRLERIGARHG